VIDGSNEITLLPPWDNDKLRSSGATGDGRELIGEAAHFYCEMMKGNWVTVGLRPPTLPELVRLQIHIGLLTVMALVGCTSAPQDTAAAESAYATGMLAQGFVELVGDDLALAPLPSEPSQADMGSETYQQICLACHGDWGQGLTDTWREEWGEDANCWQSRCHAPNHPPQGFQLPKSVPALLGPSSLIRFNTAAELKQNILETMPWWNPGSLTDDQAQALTAYLMRARGELDDQVTLDTGNASVYRLHSAYVPPPNPRAGVALLVVSLAAAAITLQWWKQKK
jgi:mono/diheme cytochrome c family protein